MISLPIAVTRAFHTLSIPILHSCPTAQKPRDGDAPEVPRGRGLRGGAAPYLAEIWNGGTATETQRDTTRQPPLPPCKVLPGSAAKPPSFLSPLAGASPAVFCSVLRALPSSFTATSTAGPVRSATRAGVDVHVDVLGGVDGWPEQGIL